MEKPKRNLVHSKERLYFAIALICSTFTYALLAFTIVGLVIIIVITLIASFFHTLNMAHIRRNSVRIFTQQFSEI